MPDCLIFVARMILIGLVCNGGMRGAQGAGGDEPTGTPEEIGTFLLETMLKRAASLVTGEFTGSVEDVLKGSEAGDEIVKGEFRSIFDFTGPRLRFDYRTTANDPKAQPENYHYLETSGSSVVYNELTHYEITRGPYDGKSSRNDGYFDVRSLGLDSLSELSRGKLLTEAEGTFRKTMSAPIGRRLNDENHWELEASFTIDVKASPNDPVHVRKRFVLDAERGYAPILQERFYFTPKGGNGPVRTDSVKVDWKRQDEIWIPSDVVMVRYSRKPNQGHTRTLHLDWKSANQEVGNHNFDKSDWILRPGTNVVDDRGDRPVLLHTVD